jgi:hypothetical protein
MKVHWYLHNSLPSVFVLSQMNLINTSTLYSNTFHFNIIIPCKPRSSEWSLPFRFSNQNFVRITHLPVRATTPVYRILLCLTILTIPGEEYKLWAPHCTALPSLPSLRPSQVQIFSYAPCSQSPSICLLPSTWETEFHTHETQQVQL